MAPAVWPSSAKSLPIVSFRRSLNNRLDAVILKSVRFTRDPVEKSSEEFTPKSSSTPLIRSPAMRFICSLRNRLALWRTAFSNPNPPPAELNGSSATKRFSNSSDTTCLFISDGLLRRSPSLLSTNDFTVSFTVFSPPSFTTISKLMVGFITLPLIFSNT
ncbi:hypothetical protein D3C80_1700980 [compost metagenome]